MIQIKEKEARILALLQYAYKNVAVLTPAKIYAEAKKYRISDDMVDFILNDGNVLMHDMIGEMHIYKWALKLKKNGDLIPNIHMVRNIIDRYDAINRKKKQLNEDIKSNIAKLNHPMFDTVTQFRVSKFITHMYLNAQEWTNVKDVKPSEAMNEIGVGLDCLTVMICMNIIFAEGPLKNRSYKWNPNVICDDDLVLEILENRKKYKHDRTSIKRYASETQVIVEHVSEQQSQETEPVVAETSFPRKGIKHFKWTAEEEWAVIQGVREGLNYVEIAALLGRSNGAVSGKIHFLKKVGKIIENSEESKPVEHAEPENNVEQCKEDKRPGFFMRLLTKILK